MRSGALSLRSHCSAAAMPCPLSNHQPVRAASQPHCRSWIVCGKDGRAFTFDTRLNKGWMVDYETFVNGGNSNFNDWFELVRSRATAHTPPPPHTPTPPSALGLPALHRNTVARRSTAHCRNVLCALHSTAAPYERGLSGTGPRLPSDSAARSAGPMGSASVPPRCSMLCCNRSLLHRVARSSDGATDRRERRDGPLLHERHDR